MFPLRSSPYRFVPLFSISLVPSTQLLLSLYWHHENWCTPWCTTAHNSLIFNTTYALLFTVAPSMAAFDLFFNMELSLLPSPPPFPCFSILESSIFPLISHIYSIHITWCPFLPLAPHQHLPFHGYTTSSRLACPTWIQDLHDSTTPFSLQIPRIMTARRHYDNRGPLWRFLNHHQRFFLPQPEPLSVSTTLSLAFNHIPVSQLSFLSATHPCYLRGIVHPTPFPISACSIYLSSTFFKEPLIHTGLSHSMFYGFPLALPPTIHAAPIFSSDPSNVKNHHLRQGPSLIPLLSFHTSICSPFILCISSLTPRLSPFTFSSKNHGYALTSITSYAFSHLFSTTHFPPRYFPTSILSTTIITSPNKVKFRLHTWHAFSHSKLPTFLRSPSSSSF